MFQRQQVRRLLSVSERQLQTWERQLLIEKKEEYRFSDLLTLKTILRLRQEKVSPQKIRTSLLALRDRLKHSPELLNDIRVFSQGDRVHVQVGKVRMEAISGQLVFDFRDTELRRLLQIPKLDRDPEKTAEAFRKKMEADRWFEQGLELERRGAPITEIIEAYKKAAELDPRSAGALVNLGTIFFNGHAWADAEAQYLKALEIDPDYPLAHFNLANLYDERGDQESALEHYRIAIRLFPNYSDAHYNLALLYQQIGSTLEAVRHWKIYLRLDGGSAWGEVARRELARLQASTVVRGSGTRAALALVDDRPSFQ